MAAKTLFVRNNNASAFEIADLGIILTASQEVDILTIAQIHDVIESARNGDLAAAEGSADIDYLDGLGGSVVDPDDVLDYWITKNWHDGLDQAAATINSSNPVVEDSDERLLPKLTTTSLTNPASITAGNIDAVSLLDITTTAVTAVTLPTPTAAAQDRLLIVAHNDDSTSTLSVNSQDIGAGQHAMFIWDGDAWHAADSQAAPTFQQVYDAGSKTINMAGNGPIELTGYGVEAPLLISPTGTAPTNNLSDGEIFMFEIAGKPTLMVRDDGRSKWLSDKIMCQVFSRDKNVDSGYLNKGDQMGNDSGMRMLANGTIIAVSVQIASGNNTKAFYLRINGSLTNSDTYTLATQNDYDETNTDIDFTAGDYLDIFVDAAGTPVADPVVVLWYCWRA